ncbi:DUF6527 family protein (plasmid) [Rhizobium sp. CB3060]|uniref:DUF6527 family protein n=1 Tax=Rhizobium sp. CB3060 TaxID=3138255 RepID=UPI0021A590D1|nr:DUF6527 family protein [Rhizobium tropici]UWU25437.1 DUF6527 family protein [Rhizobium tropici]
MKVSRLKHRFVEAFPEKMEEGMLYVALEYDTMSHMCACGCGNEVVTPLSPKDWKFSYDGKTVSVDPSVGSWSLACQSHYVIRNGNILWADKWDEKRIKAGRERDLAVKRGSAVPPTSAVPADTKPVTQRTEPPAVKRVDAKSAKPTSSFWSAVLAFFMGRK